MWLFTTGGFVSVAQKGKDREALTLRARARADLARFLADYLPNRESTEIVEGGGTDYPFRVEVTRAELRLAAARAVEAIDYPNFKDAVTKRLGQRYHDVASRVWGALLSLEPRDWWRKFGGPRSSWSGVKGEPLPPLGAPPIDYTKEPLRTDGSLPLDDWPPNRRPRRRRKGR